jgi:hypothetical protein
LALNTDFFSSKIRKSFAMAVDLTVDAIKRRAGEFDIDSVYTLSFIGMRLRSMSAVAACTSLTELDVSDNGLVDLSALGGLAQLKRLFASTNRVTRLEPLRGLESLHTLRLDANEVANLDEVSHLAALANLQVVYFRKVYEEIASPNPICAHPAYRPTVLRLISNLSNLDGERIRADSDGTAAGLLYSEPEERTLPPLVAPTVERVFSKAELSAFHAQLKGAPALDPAVSKELETLLHDSKRLVAKAASLVSNYT